MRFQCQACNLIWEDASTLFFLDFEGCSVSLLRSPRGPRVFWVCSSCHGNALQSQADLISPKNEDYIEHSTLHVSPHCAASIPAPAPVVEWVKWEFSVGENHLCFTQTSLNQYVLTLAVLKQNITTWMYGDHVIVTLLMWNMWRLPLCSSVTLGLCVSDSFP